MKKYSPFGEDLTGASSGFGYNGEYTDAATGMIYLRARFYDPAMNRFSQKDALRGNINNPLSLNRYLYCENNPVNFVDRSGLAKTAANTKAKTTDGGNSQREARITGGSSTTAAKASQNKPITGNSYSAAISSAKKTTQSMAGNSYSAAISNTKKTTNTQSMAGNSYSAAIANKSSTAYITPSNPKVSSNTSLQCDGGTGTLIKFDVNWRGISLETSSMPILMLYSAASIALDGMAVVGAIVGVVAAAATMPETAGASFLLATAFLETFSLSVTKLVSDISDIKQNVISLNNEGKVKLDIIQLLPDSGSSQDIFSWAVL